MKKILLIFAALFMISACQKKTPDNSVFTNDKTAIQSNNSVIQSDKTVILSDSEESNLTVDIDLSVMNSNMVFAEVFNMLVEPELYNNKVIKMRGNFTIYDNELTGGKAYSVIISDALACCQQGIEFQYDFGSVENEPKEGGIVTVIGRYITETFGDDVSYSYVKAQSVEM